MAPVPPIQNRGCRPSQVVGVQDWSGLDPGRQGPELPDMRPTAVITLATVFVPEGKFTTFRGTRSAMGRHLHPWIPAIGDQERP